MKKKAVFNWSGGKDSALALQKVLKEDQYEVIALLTTINEVSRNSSMHLIPTEIIEAQAASIGIPLYKVMLPADDLKGYENAMIKAVEHFKAKGVAHFIFGDIFLHDVKEYREKQLSPFGIEVVEPLWNKTPEEIIEEFLTSGIQTKVVVTQADKLDESFVGRIIDRNFIDSLPSDVDCCGENGEYHSLSYNGPIFRHEVKFDLGKPEKLSYTINLDDGNTQTFSYWHTKINAPKL